MIETIRDMGLGKMRNIFSINRVLNRNTIQLTTENCAVSLVRYLSQGERNGRVFVIGDIHGEFLSLMSALHAVDFNFDNDLAIFVGDILDRGKNSGKCLDLLQEPWVRSTFGNHEWMMLDTVDKTGLITGNISEWVSNGGEWALGESQEDLAKWRHHLLDRVPLYWILERRDMSLVLVCHAEPEPAYLADVIALKDRQVSVQALGGSQTIWGRSIIYNALSDKLKHKQYNIIKQFKDILFSAHGHTPVETPIWINNQLFTDTGAVSGRRLTLVDIDVAAPGLSKGIYSWDVLSQKLLSIAAYDL
ncbi:MAG: metallophosphoesterase [Oryzomonas sp.]|jgi:serine/threonine protein phosphatase 1